MVTLFTIFFAGCSASDNMQMKLSTPKTFAPGKTFPMQIQISDNQGHPIKGANVSATLNMKNMDHETIPVSIQEIGVGKYIGISNLAMNGDWVATIKVVQNGKTTEVDKTFSVEAATMENAHKVTKKQSLPDFKLTDENGNPVTKQDLLGKTVVMTFTYVNCLDPNACPVLLGNFRNLQQDLKSKGINTSHIALVSVSVDPENDTPQKLKEHAKEMNFDMSYLKMLTGKMSEIKKITSPLGEHFSKNGSTITHDNKTLIFDSNGNLTHKFNGSYIDRQELLQVVANEK